MQIWKAPTDNYIEMTSNLENVIIGVSLELTHSWFTSLQEKLYHLSFILLVSLPCYYHNNKKKNKYQKQNRYLWIPDILAKIGTVTLNF